MSLPRARAQRQSPAATERLLWGLLRNRRLSGLKFRRQVAIGPYVVDFLCPRHRLIVEADGPWHDPDRDAGRDAWLAAQGFRVMRFCNHEIQSSPTAVLDKVLRAIGRLAPSPLAGEGGPPEQGRVRGR